MIVGGRRVAIDALSGQAWQRWGAHAIVSAPCGHTFGENCLLAHIRMESSAGRRPSCPACKARIKQGAADVWRLYVANQDEADDSPDNCAAAGLAHERQVELRAPEAARLRAEHADAALAALVQQSSVHGSGAASAVPLLRGVRQESGRARRFVRYIKTTRRTRPS